TSRCEAYGEPQRDKVTCTLPRANTRSVLAFKLSSADSKYLKSTSRIGYPSFFATGRKPAPHFVIVYNVAAGHHAIHPISYRVASVVSFPAKVDVLPNRCQCVPVQCVAKDHRRLHVAQFHVIASSCVFPFHFYYITSGV